MKIKIEIEIHKLFSKSYGRNLRGNPNNGHVVNFKISNRGTHPVNRARYYIWTILDTDVLSQQTKIGMTLFYLWRIVFTSTLLWGGGAVRYSTSRNYVLFPQFSFLRNIRWLSSCFTENHWEIYYILHSNLLLGEKSIP